MKKNRKTYKLLILTALLLLSRSMGAQNTETVMTAELADRIIREGEKYTGVPYHMGANGPKAFDCSGFVRYVYAKFGYDLPHSSDRMSKCGTPVSGSLSELQKGDLVFFSGRRHGGGIGHVGIYIGPDKTDDSFLFIHAAVRGGVQVSRLKEEYYSSRFKGACRILPSFYAQVPEQEPVPASGQLPENVVEPRRDTLQLAAGDMRIIVFASGSWTLVDEEGNLVAPDTDKRLVLNTNGTWSAIRMSSHTIPSLEPAPAPVDTLSAAPAESPSDTAIAETQNAPAAAVAATEPDSVKEQYHTVRKGETLFSISKKYGTTVNGLCSLNGLNAKSILKVGKRLRVK